MKLCQSCQRIRWIVGNDRPLFAINLTNQTSSLPSYIFYWLSLGSSSAAISSHAVCTIPSTKAESLTFSFRPTVLSQLICSFPSWLKKPHREWERSYIRLRKSYLYPNRATALDKLHLNLACCICAVGKSLRYTMIHRFPYSREILRLFDWASKYVLVHTLDSITSRYLFGFRNLCISNLYLLDSWLVIHWFPNSFVRCLVIRSGIGLQTSFS